jgi:hypothetical protein
MGTGQPPMVDTQQMPIDGIPDDLPPQQPPQMVQQPPMQAPNPNDPDSSPEMSLLWDAWHRRVAENIFQRFNFFAKAAFRRSPPLMSSVSYVVTRDGRIMNLQVQQKSPNVLFNVLVFQAVKSLDGDLSILQFPQGSRRQFVPKSGVFTQNYGGQEGFRHTTGDEERIRQQQVMR